MAIAVQFGICSSYQRFRMDPTTTPVWTERSRWMTGIMFTVAVHNSRLRSSGNSTVAMVQVVSIARTVPATSVRTYDTHSSSAIGDSAAERRPYWGWRA